MFLFVWTTTCITKTATRITTTNSENSLICRLTNWTNKRCWLALNGWVSVPFPMWGRIRNCYGLGNRYFGFWNRRALIINESADYSLCLSRNRRRNFYLSGALIITNVPYRDIEKARVIYFKHCFAKNKWFY